MSDRLIVCGTTRVADSNPSLLQAYLYVLEVDLLDIIIRCPNGLSHEI
jgi:hypothetical protein